ncbi:MAG: HAMP domain-containing sensor histidine kinase [Burkholderiaceae bacterium]
MIARRWARTSLAVRLVLVFVGSATAIWIGLLLWSVESGLRAGRAGLAAELDGYARQVMAVARAMSDRPAALAAVVEEVQGIERTPAAGDGEGEQRFAIELRVGERTVSGPPPGLARAPEWGGVGNGLHADGALPAGWWFYQATDRQARIGVRLWVAAQDRASILWPQAPAFFLPVLASLPLLVLPAWLMVRIGLRPLRSAADQIQSRVNSGSLEPLSGIVARDLEPVVAAVNALMGRLRLRLRRERELVADVAHELKTPLAIVRINLALLRSAPDPQRGEQVMSDLDQGLARADRLVQQLLRMAMLDREFDASVVIREFDLAEFLRQRVVQVAPLATRRSVDLVAHMPDSLVCRQDADAVAAVFDNLVDNAIKYAPADSSVEITLGPVSDGAVRLQVVDHGPGIPAADSDRMLERFTRLHGPVGDAGVVGSGLGLAIVCRALERLGGTGPTMADAAPGLDVTVAFPLRSAGAARWREDSPQAVGALARDHR